MSCGNDFVKTLKKIGYPKADELNGEDFDWLFESLEDKSFLEWFCENVNEEHVVSEKELQDFDNLVQSGKPILEGNALDEVLKTLKPVDSKNSSQKEEEEEELEDELQTLQQLKKLQTHRHNKLQMMVVANTQMLKISESREQEARKYLKDSLEIFIAANKKLSSELQPLIEAAKKLSSFFTASDSEQGSAQHPVFFSQLSLDKYLAQEEQNTAALTSYVKKHKRCYQGMSEWADKSEDTFQLGDTSKQVTCVETADVCEEIKEIARLQTAYICAQHQRIKMQAKEESMNSFLKCAESMLQSLESKDIEKQENLDAKISNLNDEISRIRQDITRINREELFPLLKENAQRFIAPVVKAYIDHQIAQQEYYASRQDEIYRHLVRQKASFELIELACEMELKKHKEMCCHVENLVESLKQSAIDLQRGIQVITEQTERAKPGNTISSEDGFSYRLHQLLEGENNQILFKTYESLEQMAQQLKQDCARAEDELAASSQEQSLLLSKMKSDVDSVYNALYRGGNQLQLRSPELTDLFNQLEADLKKLNKLLADLVADVKSKKSFIDSNKLHQIERNLYVYFFKDEDRLREMVEELEKQSEAKGSSLEDEKFTTSGFLNI